MGGGSRYLKIFLKNNVCLLSTKMRKMFPYMETRYQSIFWDNLPPMIPSPPMTPPMTLNPTHKPSYPQPHPWRLPTPQPMTPSPTPWYKISTPNVSEGLLTTHEVEVLGQFDGSIFALTNVDVSLQVWTRRAQSIAEAQIKRNCMIW